MGQSPTARLLRMRDEITTLERYCSICHYLHDTKDGKCEHRPASQDVSRPQSRFSDFSFYTARTTNSDTADIPISTIRAKISISPLARKPALRHKASPTELSLRDLREEQLRQALIRSKRSEEQLQQAYESQILEYLGSAYEHLDTVRK